MHLGRHFCKSPLICHNSFDLTEQEPSTAWCVCLWDICSRSFWFLPDKKVECQGILFVQRVTAHAWSDYTLKSFNRIKPMDPSWTFPEGSQHRRGFLWWVTEITAISEPPTPLFTQTVRNANIAVHDHLCLVTKSSVKCVKNVPLLHVFKHSCLCVCVSCAQQKLN